MSEIPLRSHVLHLPEHLSNGIQVSVHSVPRSFYLDLEAILPGVPVRDGEPKLLLVPTCQRSTVDLVNWGDIQAIEKDLLLERFVAWAGAVCDALGSRGFWGDYVDPCSGQAVRTPYSHSCYPEVEAFESLLKWRTFNCGGCKVLSHPEWQTFVYPATLFARAPLDALLEAMRHASETVVVKDRDSFLREREG